MGKGKWDDDFVVGGDGVAVVGLDDDVVVSCRQSDNHSLPNGQQPHSLPSQMKSQLIISGGDMDSRKG